MFCEKCGQKLVDSARFCANCGMPVALPTEVSTTVAEPQPEIKVETAPVEPVAPIVPVAPVKPQPSVVFAHPVLAALYELFSSAGYLVMCILMTASVAIACFNASFDVLAILCVVAMWCARGAATTGNPAGFSFPLKTFKVSTQIVYILNWIAVAFLFVAAGVLVASGIYLFTLDDNYSMQELEGELRLVISEAMNELSEITGSNPFEFTDIIDGMVSFLVTGGLIVLGIVFVLMAVIVMLLNIFGYGSFYRCSKSVLNSFLSGEMNFSKVSAATSWLMVFGILEIFTALSALSGTDFVTLLSSSLAGVTMIIASVNLKKYLGQ